MNTTKDRKFTLKKDGRYFTRQGEQSGFLSHGLAGCYSYDQERIERLHAQFGGEIVEVVHESDPKNPGRMRR